MLLQCVGIAAWLWLQVLHTPKWILCSLTAALLCFRYSQCWGCVSGSENRVFTAGINAGSKWTRHSLRRVKWATEADVYRLPFSLIVSCCPGRDIRRSFSAALLAETSWTCLRPFRKVLTPFARRETTRAVLWISLAIRMMFFPLISSFELPYAI